MKTHLYQRRFYRNWIKESDLYVTHIIAKETDLEILTNKKLDKTFVEEKIKAYRWDIENYIHRDPRFFSSLSPVSVELTAPAIVKSMAESAKVADVGPMASVAGAIAEFLGKDLLKAGYKDVIIENGGDIFLKSSKIRRIGIYAGRSKLWNKLSIKIKPSQTPLGICTSSGTLGHSLSFGCADSVVILSKNTLLADAVATASANKIQSKDDLQKAIDYVRSVKEITAAAVILKNKLSSWGKIEFTR